VNAPLTWPNSSLSSRLAGYRAAVDGDERLALAGPRSWRARATSSLPVPLSPVMSTVGGRPDLGAELGERQMDRSPRGVGRLHDEDPAGELDDAVVARRARRDHERGQRSKASTQFRAFAMTGPTAAGSRGLRARPIHRVSDTRCTAHPPGVRHQGRGLRARPIHRVRHQGRGLRAPFHRVSDTRGAGGARPSTGCLTPGARAIHRVSDTRGAGCARGPSTGCLTPGGRTPGIPQRGCRICPYMPTELPRADRRAKSKRPPWLSI
jgi:hypothetical protein